MTTNLDNHADANAALWAGLFRRMLIALVGFGCLSCGGCVALNIPSYRHLDPHDDGGVFGGWNQPKRLGVPIDTPVPGDSSVIASDRSDAPMGCGPTGHCGGVHGPVGGPGSFEDECFGAPIGMDGGGDVPVEKPEVPWPKFHPVPTRPVFGAASY
ncbi:hypothetical protein [Crateriforma conspicua]|uniref:Uncharacterized protein n=1 Tax=Crateriforma conspicua TaxID=2527996 RepID=A0A5C5Y8P8_9PLAN|nr:hypothetical protein [Crateriforma conspicua]QDV64329.1 hypothetical protein Mal65_34830 [Crateriforma conspicua]TWT69732.1 hypothetical protein Pan14r_20240 [Crateriforma conspicua]